MPAISLPVLTLPLRTQRYSCHGCGNCCRDFTVQLCGEDLRKLRQQDWEERMGGPVTIAFRGVEYLRQRADGACVFLMEDGLCRIHKEFGFAAKPIACQLFPFHLTPNERGIMGGINFACQSVLENKGAELKTHINELRRMAGELDELRSPAQPPPLTQRLRASAMEERSLIEHIDAWLARDDVSLPLRLDGLAWIALSLAKANLANVRDGRFNDLLDVLFSALPEELEHHPIDAPSTRQMRMLRQAVFARTEDPKLSAIEKQGRLRIILGQLGRNRRFKSGKGRSPIIGWGSDGWSPVDLREVDSVSGASDPAQIELIDDLLTRWLRASVLGGRAWGAGYYGWSMVDGLQALLLNAACVGWLARLHAAGRVHSPSPSADSDQSNQNAQPRERAGVRESDQAIPDDDACAQSIIIEDIRAALGRIDRTAGRAKWLGSSAERLRLRFLNADDGLRRVIARCRLIDDEPV